MLRLAALLTRFIIRGYLYHPSSISAWVMFWWGLWVFCFDPFDSSPSFAVMREWAESEVWGIALMVIGLVRMNLYAWWVITGIHFERRRRIAAWISVLSTTLWFLVFVTYVQANWRSTATPIYFNLLLISLVGFLNVAGWLSILDDYLDTRKKPVNNRPLG